MKRPLEQDYTSLAAYTRALEEYCNGLNMTTLEGTPITEGYWNKTITAIKEALAQPTGQAPCVRHCEANAFKIMIRNLKGDIERLKQRTWAGIEQSDMPSDPDPMYDHEYFIAGMVYANYVLKEKNT